MALEKEQLQASNSKHSHILYTMNCLSYTQCALANIITGDIDEDDEDDGVCAVSAGSSQVLQYEYHIVYSCSYSSPVLYFRAFTLG